MAVEVLRGGIIYHVRHDLESFYWLLIWLVLRHTKTSVADPCSKLKVLFDQPNDDDCVDMKRGWLGKEFTVDGNLPINYLLENFSELCADNSNVKTSRPAPVPLTYKLVLDLFDEVLKREDWPPNDVASPYELVASQNQLGTKTTCLRTRVPNDRCNQGGPDSGATLHTRRVSNSDISRAAVLGTPSGDKSHLIPRPASSGSEAQAVQPRLSPSTTVATRHQHTSGSASSSSLRNTSAGAPKDPLPVPPRPSPDSTGPPLGSVHDQTNYGSCDVARAKPPQVQAPTMSRWTPSSPSVGGKGDGRKRAYGDVTADVREPAGLRPSKHPRTRRQLPPPSDRWLRKRH